jgi:tetratricopeptide (TPR) repeat protein
MENLASALHDLNKLDEAEGLYIRTLGLRRRVMGPDDPQVADTLGNLATLKRDRGDLGAAEALLREALEIRRRTAGDHPDTALSLGSLAVIVASKGDFDGALPLAEEAVAMRRRLAGPRNHEAARALANLGQIQQAKGDFAASELTLREALDQLREFFGPADAKTMAAAGGLGNTLAELAWSRFEKGDGGAAGVAAEGEELLRSVAASAPAAQDVQANMRRSQLGGAIVVVEAFKVDAASVSRLQEAEGLLKQSYAALEPSAGTSVLGKKRMHDAAQRLVRLYTVWERVEPGAAAKSAPYRDNQ